MRTRSRNSAFFVAFLCILVHALSACGHGRGLATGRLTGHRLRRVMSIASRDMGCPASQLTPMEIAEGVVSVSGCGDSREYAMACPGRHHCEWTAIQPVAQVAITELQCATGTVAVQAPTSTVRDVSACGATLRYQLMCSSVGCGWARDPATPLPMQQPQIVAASAQPQVVVASSAQPQTTIVVPQAPVGVVATGTAVIDETTVRRVLGDRIDAARACFGGQAGAQVIGEIGGDGRVLFRLPPPHAGTAAEACVQTALGSFQLSGAARVAGTVTITL